MNPSPHRRRALYFIGVAAVAPLLPTPALPDERAATPRMTEGPFYPTSFPADSDGDLTRVAGRPKAADGVVLDVSGRIVDRTGRPLARAKLEVWQCDAFGQYHHVGEPAGSGDANFQGYGAVMTDGEGRYAFRTIRPVPYSGRTPHIHFTVVEAGRRRLTSQMFIEGDPGNERDFLYRNLGRDARLVTMRLEDAPKDSGAKLRGSLEVVV